MDKEREKIQIRPKGTVVPRGVTSSGQSKDLEELKEEVRRLKKSVGRLMNLAGHEENILEQYKEKEIILKLSDGTEEKGILQEITKFQIVVKRDEVKQYYYKSSLVKYSFVE